MLDERHHLCVESLIPEYKVFWLAKYSARSAQIEVDSGQVMNAISGHPEIFRLYDRDTKVMLQEDF